MNMATLKEIIDEKPSCSSHVSPIEAKRRKIDIDIDSAEKVATESPDNKTESQAQEDDAMTTEDSNSDSEEDSAVHSIVDSITQQEIDEFKPFHERYFSKKYCTKFSKDSCNLDTCIRVHTNKIYLVYLSERHSIIKNQQRIKYINFQVSKNVNRLKNVTVGKGKKRAQLLQPDSVLCYLQTEDNVQYPVHAGVFGKLLEINERIKVDHNFLVDNLNEGFLAIILPDLQKHEENVKMLTSNEEYN